MSAIGRGLEVEQPIVHASKTHLVGTVRFG